MGERRHRRAAAAGLLAALSACGADPPPPALDVGRLLGETAPGFERAEAPRAFRFPDDHGAHERFRSEWWYFTGNLAAADGRRFGFQLTLFRFALRPAPVARDSAFAASQVYMGHFALTDVAGGRLRASERFSRAALGLAGAALAPVRVWLEDWRVEGDTAGFPPVRLVASGTDYALDLRLAPGKPPVLHGDRGLSRKSAEPGNASYYYSYTRLPAEGVVRVGGERIAVRGLAWMDREWSTSALAADQAGWDWFALQLDDGSELMYYQLRRRDGSADPASAGTRVDAGGAARPIAAQDLELAVLDHWRSPDGGARYPARWRLGLREEALELDVEPLVADQELRLSFRYWEGAVRVRGTRGGRPVAGHGYVELTGYAGRAPGGG